MIISLIPLVAADRALHEHLGGAAHGEPTAWRRAIVIEPGVLLGRFVIVAQRFSDVVDARRRKLLGLRNRVLQASSLVVGISLLKIIAVDVAPRTLSLGARQLV